MKNAPKTLKKLLPCAIGFGLLSLSILTPFTGLKTASAEQGFPPSFNPTGNTTEFVSVFPLNAFTVSAVGGSVEGEEYNTAFVQQYALPPFVDSSTVHEQTYALGEFGQVDLKATSTEFNYRLLSTANYLYAPSAFYGVELVLNTPFYLDQALYEYVFSSPLAPFGVYFSLSSAYTDLYTITADYDFAFGVYKNGYYDTTHIQGEDTFPNSKVYRSTDYFPSWDELVENGVVYEDYVYLNDFSFRCFCRISYYNQSYIGVSVQKNSINSTAGLLLTDFKNIQTAGQYAHKTYNKIPVDDIGLQTVANAVSDFFNVEFIPGFRLWYFLLIGLGCAVVGIALKFFLGG